MFSNVLILASYVFLQSKHPRQPKGDFRENHNQRQSHNHRKEQRQKRLDHLLNRNLGNAHTDEKYRTHRRGTEPDAEIGYHHDPKVNRIYTELGHDGQKYRRKDQNRRGHIHKDPYKQQEQINQDQDDDLIVTE